MNRIGWTWMALAALIVAFVAGAARAEDWPQWRGPGRDCITKTLPEKLPEKVEPVWKKDLSGLAYSGTVVVGEYVVCGDSVGGAEGEGAEGETPKDVWRCFKAADGTEVWAVEYANTAEEMAYGTAPRATPVIHDGRVFTLGSHGDVRAIDLKTGKVAWEMDLKEAFKGHLPEWGYCSSPMIAGGNLILNPGGSKGGVVAVNPKDGKTIWTANADDANYSSFITAKPGGVEQIIGYDQMSVFGLKIADGSRLWTLPVENSMGYIVPSPVVAGEVLVLTGEDGTYAFPFENGKCQDKLVGDHEYFVMENNTPIVVGGMVVGTSVGEGLMALDPAAGLKQLWLNDEESGFRDFSTILATPEGRLAVFDARGQLHLGTARTDGVTVHGKVKLTGPTSSAPAWTGTHVYWRDGKALYCFKPAP